jgi:hypothetical protein
VVEEDTPRALCIRDVGHSQGCPTVTNDAEYAVVQLADRLNGRPLEYLDSEGERSQLLVNDGQFAGFAPCG